MTHEEKGPPKSKLVSSDRLLFKFSDQASSSNHGSRSPTKKTRVSIDKFTVDNEDRTSQRAESPLSKNVIE